MPVDAAGRDVAQALDGVGQRAGEMRPAPLAVGHHVEARTLLQRDRPVDGRVLDALELRGRELAVLVLTARLEQLGRPSSEPTGSARVTPGLIRLTWSPPSRRSRCRVVVQHVSSART